MQELAALLRIVLRRNAFGVVAILLACSSSAVSSVTASRLEELRLDREAPLLLDVRTREEYEAGHIPGAIHIPHTELAARVSELRIPDSGVVVYCQKGPRARLGEQTLLEHGVSGVAHLEDGFSGWQAAGLPIEQTSR
jgi:phage shock protein E